MLCPIIYTRKVPNFRLARRNSFVVDKGKARVLLSIRKSEVHSKEVFVGGEECVCFNIPIHQSEVEPVCPLKESGVNVAAAYDKDCIQAGESLQCLGN